MPRNTTIQYPTALLKEERPLIRESVQKALLKLTAGGYQKSLRLLPDDPTPLYQWRLKKAPWDNKAGDSLWPDKTAYFENITLRNVVEQLTRQAECDEQLEQWLRRLLAPFGRHVDRLAQVGKVQRFLITHWIAPDNYPLPRFFGESLCFYSNHALAQLLHLCQWGKPLPATRLGTAEKTAAKVVERLGLRRAKLGIIREMPFIDGRFVPLPYEARRV
ncbi:MAG: hypothetical protein HY735_25285 [Verrucomicrobia bacterium]|nr:hypothetical protein [Verrucomicrobiota bacterium]